MKLNLSLLEDISDDIDFCFKLAREESVVILPGTEVQSYLLAASCLKKRFPTHSKGYIDISITFIVHSSFLTDESIYKS